MTIDTADKLVAMLQGLQCDDVRALPPAERRRLVEALEAAHRAAKGEATTAHAKSGILADLKDSRGRQ